jgi:hypothetical protein
MSIRLNITLLTMFLLMALGHLLSFFIDINSGLLGFILFFSLGFFGYAPLYNFLDATFPQSK